MGGNLVVVVGLYFLGGRARGGLAVAKLETYGGGKWRWGFMVFRGGVGAMKHDTSN